MFRILFSFKFHDNVFISPVFKKINFLSVYNFKESFFVLGSLFYLNQKKSKHHALFLNVFLTKKLVVNINLIFNKLSKYFDVMLIKSIYFKFLLRTIWNKFIRKKYILNWVFMEVVFEHIFLNSSLSVSGSWSSPQVIVNNSDLFKGDYYMVRREKKCRSLRRTYRKKLLEHDNRVWYK